MQAPARHPALDHLAVLVGEWESEATHRLMPDAAIVGGATFEWLEGGFFLIWRAHYDHPDFPDSVGILSCDDTGDLRNPDGGCALHYFDQRGITRLYHLSVEPGVWRLWRDSPGFSQRFTGSISPDGKTIDGVWDFSEDGSTWDQDVRVTYRRVQ